MSVEGGENSQPTAFSSSSHRAPPPPFSASTLASNQRKRPVLSGLGSEAATATAAAHSDFTSPNTPTPYENKSEMTSLHARTTPPEPLSSFAAGTPVYHHVSHLHPQQPQPSTKEPHLSSIHALLNEFQLHFDMKKQRISALESQVSAVEARLQQREIELQSAAGERVAALKQLESQKLLLEELQKKLQEFAKYESMIASRFASFEALMSDLSATKAKYLEKEAEVKKNLQEKNSHLEDSLRLIGELRLQKGQLESKASELEHDLKQQCTDFNMKLHELNAEIKEKISKVDSLYQEREILKADLKNMSFERDRYQRESAQALKEISSLAVSDAFASHCEEDNLRSLSSAVNWVKRICTDLHDQQQNSSNFSESLKTELNAQLKLSKEESARLKRDLESSTAKCSSLKAQVEKLSESIPKLDYAKILEELGFFGPDWQSDLKSFIEAQQILEEKYQQMKDEHAKETSAIREQFSKTLQNDRAALKAKLDKAEAEIARLKSSSMPKPKENPDLTTLLGLKAFGKSLAEKEEAQAKAKKRTKIASSTSTNQKGPSRTLRSTTKLTQSPSKSQDSVVSNDIWTIFN